MIGLLRSSTCVLALSRLKALSSLALIHYPSPLYLRKGGLERTLDPTTSRRFPPAPLSRSTDDREATLLPVGRMSSPSRTQKEYV